MKAVAALPLTAALLAQLAGCAIAPAAPSLPQARPSQGQCPAVRDIDFSTLARRAAAGDPAELERVRGEQDLMLARTVPPASAPHQPGPDASVVIRAYRPSGFYSGDARVSVWKDGDGQWWFWRQDVNPYAPPPPPPPPPGRPGSPEWDAFMANPPPPPTEAERYPAVTGALDPELAGAIEANLSDPCRAWDPDGWPAVLPLNRRIDGSRERICAPDGAAYFADMIVAGQPTRRIVHACINDSPTFNVIRIVLQARTSDQA
ncbi:hypothetical protein [Brevundimonas sp. FT23028]|uniref:hypothetical protein n=1 Tax=Brevundimonas sp. FT23028 TaxID=3393748 RepID=UPI003B585D18